MGKEVKEAEQRESEPLVRGNRHYSKSKVWQKGKIGEAGMRSIIYFNLIYLIPRIHKAYNRNITSFVSPTQVCLQGLLVRVEIIAWTLICYSIVEI